MINRIKKLEFNEIEKQVIELVNELNKKKFYIQVLNKKNSINKLYITLGNKFFFNGNKIDIKKNEKFILNFSDNMITKNTIIKLFTFIIVNISNYHCHILYFEITLITTTNSKLINNKNYGYFKYISHDFKHLQVVFNSNNINPNTCVLNYLNNIIIFKNKKLSLSLYIYYIQKNICDTIYLNNKLFINFNEQKGGNNERMNNNNIYDNILKFIMNVYTLPFDVNNRRLGMRINYFDTHCISELNKLLKEIILKLIEHNVDSYKVIKLNNFILNDNDKTEIQEKIISKLQQKLKY
jgi:hypothetical protein